MARRPDQAPMKGKKCNHAEKDLSTERIEKEALYRESKTTTPSLKAEMVKPPQWKGKIRSPTLYVQMKAVLKVVSLEYFMNPHFPSKGGTHKAENLTGL